MKSEYPYDPHSEIDREEHAPVDKQPPPQRSRLGRRAGYPAHQQVDQNEIDHQPQVVEQLPHAVARGERQHSDGGAIGGAGHRDPEVPVERIDPKPASTRSDATEPADTGESERPQHEYLGERDAADAHGPRGVIGLAGDPDFIDRADVIGEADQPQHDEEAAARDRESGRPRSRRRRRLSHRTP